MGEVTQFPRRAVKRVVLVEDDELAITASKIAGAAATIAVLLPLCIVAAWVLKLPR